MPTFLRGALPSPRHRLISAEPFQPTLAAPPQFAIVPARLSMWGNDQYGDCVTAEEAFAKACYSPEIFIDDNTVIAHARKHGTLNGATLVDVLDTFQNDGFVVGNQQYNDGKYKGVDYSKESVLQSALAIGPVKIAIDANALPPGAGNVMGWYKAGRGNYPNTDHCVALCGYGPAAWLFQQLNVPLPSALTNASGYLLYTWKTIGFVDHLWLMGTCVEAWVRNPTTIGVPPLEPPPEPPTPTPTPPPGPAPVPFEAPVYDVTISGMMVGGLGRQVPVTLKGTATPRK